MNHVATAQMTLSLGAFFSENMTHVRALALIATRTRSLEPLGGPRYGLLLVGHCSTPDFMGHLPPASDITGDVVVSVRLLGVESNNEPLTTDQSQKE